MVLQLAEASGDAQYWVAANKISSKATTTIRKDPNKVEAIIALKYCNQNFTETYLLIRICLCFFKFGLTTCKRWTYSASVFANKCTIKIQPQYIPNISACECHEILVQNHSQCVHAKARPKQPLSSKPQRLLGNYYLAAGKLKIGKFFTGLVLQQVFPRQHPWQRWRQQ